MKSIKLYPNHTEFENHLPVKRYNFAVCEDTQHIHYGDAVFDSKIEYIENIAGSYINTGIKGSGSQKIECVFMPIQKTSGYNCVYGARTKPGQEDGIYIYSNNTNNNINKQYVAYNTSYDAAVNVNISLNVKHTIVQNKGLFILDGTTIKSHTNATFTSTANIFIFDGSNANVRGNYNGYFRLYSFKIYNASGVLVRNFVPVRVGSVGYLYDNVSKSLFGNVGTEAFVYGPDIY